MNILSDYHVHSYFSGDSTAPMEEMIQSAIKKGFKQICFTEHNDFDFPKTEEFPENPFLLNVDSYLYELLQLKEKYAKSINVLFGIEIGLQQSCLRENIILSKSHEFDFIIASSHQCNGFDPYSPSFWADKDSSDCFFKYFEEMLQNVKSFINYDVYGHLDYIARYVPADKEQFSYFNYSDLIDEIIKTILDNEKGIEINTSGLRKDYKKSNPCKEIIKRYKELGGEIITIGSDAHSPKEVGCDLDVAASILKDCGFEYYTTFEKRQPFFHKL